MRFRAGFLSDVAMMSMSANSTGSRSWASVAAIFKPPVSLSDSMEPVAIAALPTVAMGALLMRSDSGR